MKIHEKRILFTLFMALIIFLTHADSDSVKTGRKFLNKRFLLIIDFGYLSCPLCVQSLSEFTGMINKRALEKSILGILTFEREGDKSGFEKYIKIMEKRLRGFIIGNKIKFPIILDRYGVFKSFSKNSTTLIFFDYRSKTIKKYIFPLNKVQIKEIFQEE